MPTIKLFDNNNLPIVETNQVIIKDALDHMSQRTTSFNPDCDGLGGGAGCAYKQPMQDVGENNKMYAERVFKGVMKAYIKAARQNKAQAAVDQAHATIPPAIDGVPEDLIGG